MSYSFKKSERLKSSRLIGELFNSGDSITLIPFKFFWVISQDRGYNYPAQIAISIPIKNFRRSSDRNLIKRRIREAYRTNKQDLYQYLSDNNLHLIFVLLYMPKTIFTFRQIEDGMKKIIGRFINQLQYHALSKYYDQ